MRSPLVLYNTVRTYMYCTLLQAGDFEMLRERRVEVLQERRVEML